MKKAPLLFFVCLILLSCGHKENKIERVVGVSHVKSVKTKAATGCSFDNDVSTLGIGLVIVPDIFKLYSDSIFTTKPVSYNMYSDSISNICPKFFKPDYGIMHFICIGKTSKCYKVLINYSQVKYLTKAKSYRFKTWDQYIMTSFGLRRSIAYGKDYQVPHQPLRKETSERADTLNIPSGYEMFCPVEVKGDWVKVKFDCFYNDENSKHEGEPCYSFIDKCKNPVSGWLKWRDGNKLLVDIFLTD